MFEIRKYTCDDKAAWDSFVDGSRQGTFLFRRDYVGYHSDRFEDFSLMVYRGGRLFALLPASVDGDTLWSHQGLTYGGWITNERSTVGDMMDVFSLANRELKGLGINRVVYKPMPWIYQRQPSEEDLYALTQVCGAKIMVRNVSSTISLRHPVKMRYGRRYDGNKAEANGVVIRKDNGALAGFWKVLEGNLWNAHNARPVHSLAEMERLMCLFPNNIELYVAEWQGQIVGGTVVFVTPQVVHTQYISASEIGKKVHALDLLFRVVLEDYADWQYFDYGTSNEDYGRVLNRGLIFQKEGFGGRAVCYDWYEYNINV